jgi:hypothetical protein
MNNLISLLDSVLPIVETWNAETPAQKEWKERWLRQAREVVDKPKEEKKMDIDIDKLKEAVDTIKETQKEVSLGAELEPAEEFKRNFDAWQKSKNDKPKEYCPKGFHDVEDFYIDKPIKTEKIKPLAKVDDNSRKYYEQTKPDILRLWDKVQEIIDHFNDRV